MELADRPISPGVPRDNRGGESRRRACDRQLERERGWVDQAERRIEELQANLADAVGAERIAAGDAAALRAELGRRRRWRLLLRLRWLRGDRRTV